MGYYNELSIDTRTCGQADEDARLDRRDGYTSRRHSYSSAFTPQRRTREEWAKINAEHNERVRKTTEELRKQGRDASGNPLKAEG